MILMDQMGRNALGGHHGVGTRTLRHVSGGPLLPLWLTSCGGRGVAQKIQWQPRRCLLGAWVLLSPSTPGPITFISKSTSMDGGRQVPDTVLRGMLATLSPRSRKQSSYLLFLNSF